MTGRSTASVSSHSVAVDQFMLSPTATMLQQFLSMDADGKNDPDNGLSGLELLKQRGELLAGVLQSKLKNFETDLVSTIQAAGLDPAQAMSLQQGADGILLANMPPDKEQLSKLLGNNEELSGQFKELSRLAELLGALQQTGTYNVAGGTAAARYAQQSQTAKPSPDAQFVLNVMQGNASFSFE